MELTPGMIIAGRYRIDSRIGAGGMGEVWAGEHLSVGSRVALKTLLPAAALNHEVVARFRREAVFLSRIRSDYVARVVDFVEDPAVGLVLVMEFIDGEPLSKILQQKTLTVEEAVELGVDIVSALRDLHYVKIIHRDLKPGNIIIQRRHDGTSRAVIVDFGVSRLVKGSAEDEEMTGITRADMAVGTIEYMAPEQILNSRDVTPASDLYAVGAILFRAVAGHHVFGDLYDVELAKTKLTKDPAALQTGRRDRVAQGFEEIVAKALKRKPKERYDTSDRLLAELVALRDVMRISSIDDMDTTRDVSKASIPVFTDSTSSPSVTRPRLSSASALPVPSSVRAPAASMPPAEPSVTLKSSQPSGRGSLTGAESGPMPPPPVRRGISVGAVLALVLLALAGGAGLGVALLQGRLKGILASPAEDVPSVTPMESAEIVAASPPSAAAPPTETAAPSAEPAPEEIDLDAPAASAAASASAQAPAVKPASTVAAAPAAPAPKPAPKPSSTGEPPSPGPVAIPRPSSTSTASGSPTGAATSTDAMPQPIPKPTSTSSPSPAPQQPKPVPSSGPTPITTSNP